MQNVGIQIGTVTVSWYGLFIVLGILAGTALGYLLVCFSHLKFDDFIQIACFTGLGAMAGAKLLYLIVSWQKIDFARITDPEYLNALLGGGFVFYGGLAGGLLGLYLCGKILHIPVAEYALGYSGNPPGACVWENRVCGCGMLLWRTL